MTNPERPDMVLDRVTLVTPEGRLIRKTTRVTLRDGRAVVFEGYLPKHAAIAQAREYFAREAR